MKQSKRKGTVFSTNRDMISAQGEIQETIFEKIQGKRYTWYVTTASNRADNIYVGTENKEGMGGSTCSFKLEDGTSDDVVAPWHSGSGALLADTGVDVSETHLMSYIIAEERECDYGNKGWGSSVDTYYGVLEKVEDTLMSFDTADTRGKFFANKLGKDVFVTRISSGGSSKGMESPDKEL